MPHMIGTLYGAYVFDNSGKLGRPVDDHRSAYMMHDITFNPSKGFMEAFCANQIIEHIRETHNVELIPEWVKVTRRVDGSLYVDFDNIALAILKPVVEKLGAVF